MTQAPLAPPRSGSGAMFDRIAERYDLLNRILSGGVDRRWRRRAVAALQLAPGARVLDVATGTGDLALEMLRQQPAACVVGIDPAPRMLALASAKLTRCSRSTTLLAGTTTATTAADAAPRFTLTVGDAQELPYPDESFDAAAMAFGIRNVPDRARALRELARVVRPGGRIAILELAEPRAGRLAPLARFWIRQVVPRIGAVLSGRREYRYLQTSIAVFPPADQFARAMAEAGLEIVAVDALTFGAAVLFVARTPSRQP